MRESVFKSIFDTWVTSTPDGRPYTNHPWEEGGADYVAGRPFYVRPYGAPTAILFFLMITIGILAFVFNLKVSAGFSAGLLAVLYYALKDSWIRSGAISTRCPITQIRVTENSAYKIKISFQNVSSHGAVNGHAYIDFKGSSKGRQYIAIPQLEVGESITIELDLLSDMGMGLFELNEVLIITSDLFGFFSRCVRHDLSFRLEVSPDFVPMPSLKLTVAGKATHSGIIEGKVSGDSNSFLGLRDFRFGDSIRRIDWKRTAKHSKLLVRDFEKLNSTDATLMIDDRQAGLFEFRGVNSFEHLKDTALAICRSLIGQGIRVQVLMPRGRYLPFGSGKLFMEEISDLIRDMEPQGLGSYCAFLKENEHQVPPDSLVVPIFCAVDIDILMLQEIFFGWNAIRCQVVPVVMDVPKFERRVVNEASLFTDNQTDLTFFRQLYMGAGDVRAFENIARKIFENTIIIGPGDTIGEVYSRMYPWQR